MYSDDKRYGLIEFEPLPDLNEGFTCDACEREYDRVSIEEYHVHYDIIEDGVYCSNCIGDEAEDD